MGFPKRFEKRQIQLTGDAATVFACLSEALAGAGVDVPDVGAAVADEAVDRKGFVAFAQRLVERVAGDPRGGRLVLLPAWEYLLDARTHKLLQRYTLYLNRILRSHKVPPSATAGLLWHPVAVIREILLRFVTSSVSVSLTEVEHGRKVLNCVRTFIREILKTSLVQTKGWFSAAEIGEMGTQLISTHGQWLDCFEAVAQSVEILHSHERTVGLMLSDMYTMRTRISQFLYMQLADNYASEDDLAPDWIATRLLEREQALLRELLVKVESEDKPAKAASLLRLVQLGNSDLVPEDQLASSDHQQLQSRMVAIQEAVVSRMRRNQGQGWFHSQSRSAANQASEDIARLKELHTLYLNCTIVIDILYEVDTMITLGGWIPILTQALDLRGLYEFIAALRTRDAEVNAPSKLEHLFNRHKTSAAFRGYLKHFVSTSALDADLRTLHSSVNLLYSPQLRDFIRHTFQQSLSGVVSSQALLHREFYPYFKAAGKTMPSLVNETPFQELDLKMIGMDDADSEVAPIQDMSEEIV